MTTQAFRLGYQAGRVGDLRCPYADGSTDAHEWHVGYQEARIDLRNGR